jgi:hypothetical protein
LAFADHKAAFDIKRGEQSRCAVTLVIMRHGSGAAPFSTAGRAGSDRTPGSDFSHRRTPPARSGGFR